MALQRPGIETGAGAAGAPLGRLAALLESPRQAMDEIGRHLLAATLRRFLAEQVTDGTPWLRSARVLAGGGRTLHDSGRLQRSLTHRVAADGRAIEVGSNAIYAAIHQFGSRAGRGRTVPVPARPFLGIDERDRDAIRRILARAVEGAVQ